MNAIRKSALLASVCLLATLGTGRAEVTLSLLNNGTNLPSLTITPGQSFSLNAVAAGLTLPGLNSFEIELAEPLPTGVTLDPFTDTLPDSWFVGTDSPLERKFGGQNISGPGFEFTGMATLVRANFSTSGALTPGVYIIDFVPTNPTSQILRNPSSAAISYNDNSFSLTVVPEPSTALVAFALVGVIALYGYRRRALAKASIRVRS